MRILFKCHDKTRELKGTKNNKQIEQGNRKKRKKTSIEEEKREEEEEQC